MFYSRELRVKQTLSPVWNRKQTFEVLYTSMEKETRPPLLLFVSLWSGCKKAAKRRNFCESNVRGVTRECTGLWLVIVFAYWILNTYWQENMTYQTLLYLFEPTLYCNLAECWLKMLFSEVKLLFRRASPLWSQYPLQILRIATKHRYITMTDIVGYSMVVYQQIIRKVCPFRIQLDNDTIFGPCSLLSANMLWMFILSGMHYE